jgi:hypothetical protein
MHPIIIPAYANIKKITVRVLQHPSPFDFLQHKQGLQQQMHKTNQAKYELKKNYLLKK